MNPCMQCVHARTDFMGSHCEKERAIQEANGFADLGFPLVGDACPHYHDKNEDTPDAR